MKLYKPTKKEKRDAIDKALDRLIKRYSGVKRKFMSLEELTKHIEKNLLKDL